MRAGRTAGCPRAFHAMPTRTGGCTRQRGSSIRCRARAGLGDCRRVAGARLGGAAGRFLGLRRALVVAAPVGLGLRSWGVRCMSVLGTNAVLPRRFLGSDRQPFSGVLRPSSGRIVGLLIPGAPGGRSRARLRAIIGGDGSQPQAQGPLRGGAQRRRAAGRRARLHELLGVQRGAHAEPARRREAARSTSSPARSSPATIRARARPRTSGCATAPGAASVPVSYDGTLPTRSARGAR